MTQECEERLINDMAEVKVLLKAHVEAHAEKRSLTPVWIGIMLSTVISVFTLFSSSVNKP